MVCQFDIGNSDSADLCSTLVQNGQYAGKTTLKRLNTILYSKIYYLFTI